MRTGRGTKVVFLGTLLWAGAVAGCGSQEAASDTTIAGPAGADGATGGDAEIRADVDRDRPADTGASEDTEVRGEADADADADEAADADADADADEAADADADAAPDTDADASVDTDTTPVVRCTDLDCASEGRACVEASGGTDAVCGDCLGGFIVDGDECVAPSCRGDGDCTPVPAVGEWGDCGGYATSCSTDDGTRERLLYEGQCVAGRCEVTSSLQSEQCPEPRVTQGVACVLSGNAGLCTGGACTVAPSAPTGVSASDGTSTALVRVSWSAVDGATGYRVYRDGTLLTPTPLTTLQFDDTGAAAGGPPAQVTGVSATPTTDRITVSWSAASATGSAGTPSTYAVAAVNVVGEGARSASDAGNRAGYPLSRYEVRINGAGSWVTAGASTTYADTNAPTGTINVANVSASDGTSAAHVALSATVGTSAGSALSYEVRAVNAAGAGAASSSVSRQRTVGTPAVQWQRSSGTTASGFSDISGATSASFNDAGAPSDGSIRQYRVVASASGAATVTSSSDSGFRQVAGPLPGTLGGTCTADSQCPSGSWCSTVSGYRRCSPRLFAGQSHEMDFVYVPSGTFQQGTPGATNAERPYSATLTRNYFVSRTEVTQGQWQAATGGTNPSCFQSTSGISCSTSNTNSGAPVETIDWYSALAYANRLSSQHGLEQCYTLSPSTCADSTSDWAGGESQCTAATFVGFGCTGYRLLTESEWERAARGGTTSTYYWGDMTDTSTVGQYAWFGSNSGSRTQTAGQMLANTYGLYDMSGNVWEWVWDRYSSSYPAGSGSDYTGPASGSSRSVRGGSWISSAAALRAANRHYFLPDSRGIDVGVRLARTVPIDDISCPPPAEACATGTQNRRGCDNARTISRTLAGDTGVVISASTCSATDELDDSSDCWDANADHTYRLYMRRGESMTVQLQTLTACAGGTWNGTLKIFESTGCSNTECASKVYCEDNERNHSETYTAPRDGWVIVVADGSSAFDDEGTYELTVNLSCNDGDCGCL